MNVSRVSYNYLDLILMFENWSFFWVFVFIDIMCSDSGNYAWSMSHAKTTRSHIRDCLLCRGFSVHVADFRREVRQPWQKKWYSVMNYGTLAPQFVNDNPGRELGPAAVPLLKLFISMVVWASEQPGLHSGQSEAAMHIITLSCFLVCGIERLPSGF